MLKLFKRSSRKLIWAALHCAWASGGAVVVAEQPSRVAFTVKHVHNIQDEYFRVRDLYFIKILELAAQYSDADITFEPVSTKHQLESRTVLSVEEGVLDVHWMHTSEELESQLLPIRIPLYKGLIGWRLMLVRPDDTDLLKGVSSIEALRQFSALQSFDWPDTPILMASGFQVVSSIDFRSLFRMLTHRRADVFPRSIVEVWDELESQSDLNLKVDPHVVLFYPTAYYFFVAKENTKLRDALAQGLQRAIENGDFERHFQQHFSGDIKKANLSERALISIANPNLPVLTPLKQKQLWFTPEKIAKP